MAPDMQPLWHRRALDETALARLEHIDSAGRPGQRIPLDPTVIAALAPVTQVVSTGAATMRPVRAVAFDKTPSANWGVPWHQDRVIAVSEKHDRNGYKNWSQKQGQWHCEPPLSILQEMFFVRIHLDDAGPEEGAMEIAKGSDQAGAVPAEEAEETALRYPQEVCTACRGDILVLPMLTLHRSLPGTAPRARRVLRVDYAGFDLPTPLTWAS